MAHDERINDPKPMEWNTLGPVLIMLGYDDPEQVLRMIFRGHYGITDDIDLDVARCLVAEMQDTEIFQALDFSSLKAAQVAVARVRKRLGSESRTGAAMIAFLHRLRAWDGKRLGNDRPTTDLRALYRSMPFDFFD